LTAYSRKRRASRVAKAYRLRKAHGWHSTLAWMPESAFQSLAARAAQLGMTRQSVLSAALVSGLRNLSVSEIQRLDALWHQTVKRPHDAMFKPGNTHQRRRPLESTSMKESPCSTDC
jgi:hypothetical protein